LDSVRTPLLSSGHMNSQGSFIDQGKLATQQSPQLQVLGGTNVHGAAAAPSFAMRTNVHLQSQNGAAIHSNGGAVLPPSMPVMPSMTIPAPTASMVGGGSIGGFGGSINGGGPMLHQSFVAQNQPIQCQRCGAIKVQSLTPLPFCCQQLYHCNGCGIGIAYNSVIMALSFVVIAQLHGHNNCIH
jgi:hypothetical protein